MEINRGATLDPGRIMVEQCKSDNYETSYITFFNECVHLFALAHNRLPVSNEPVERENHSW